MLSEYSLNFVKKADISFFHKTNNNKSNNISNSKTTLFFRWVDARQQIFQRPSISVSRSWSKIRIFCQYTSEKWRQKSDLCLILTFQQKVEFVNVSGLQLCNNEQQIYLKQGWVKVLVRPRRYLYICHFSFI